MKELLVCAGIIGMCVSQIISRKADLNIFMENNKEIEINVDFAQDLINQEATSEKYKNMSLEERKEYVQGILSQLEKGGYIKYLLYDNDNYLFSFEYSNGTLGGWMIKDFAASDGLIPMN